MSNTDNPLCFMYFYVAWSVSDLRPFWLRLCKHSRKVQYIYAQSWCKELSIFYVLQKNDSVYKRFLITCVVQDDLVKFGQKVEEEFMFLIEFKKQEVEWKFKPPYHCKKTWLEKMYRFYNCSDPFLKTPYISLLPTLSLASINVSSKRTETTKTPHARLKSNH